MEPEYRQPVLVEWTDSASRSDSWTGLNDAIHEARNLVRISTCGFIVRRTRQFILLARSVDDYESDPNVDGIFQVPTGCIRRIVKLRAPSRPRRKAASTSQARAVTARRKIPWGPSSGVVNPTPL